MELCADVTNLSYIYVNNTIRNWNPIRSGIHCPPYKDLWITLISNRFFEHIAKLVTTATGIKYIRK